MMSLTSIEKSFIEKWKEIDFSDWKETDIREDFIAPLLRILGYAKNTLNDIKREHALRLSEPYQRIGRKRVYIDYIPTFKLKSFWIIEAKSGITREMDYGDFSQAYLYANHPEVKSYYLVLINGWEIRIYDAKESSDWDDILLVCNQSNCNSTFIQLKEYLSSNKIIQTLETRIINSIKDTFSVEIEEIRLDRFREDINKTLNNLKQIVVKNSRDFQIKTDQEIDNQTKARIEKSSNKELIDLMNIPILDRPFAAEEYIKRIKNSEENERISFLLEIINKCNTNSHTIFKLWTVYIMSKLLQEGITVEAKSEFRGIQIEFNDIIRRNFTYWEENKIINAINHFDNITIRLSKKICHHLLFDKVKEYISEIERIYPKEDIIKSNLTTVSFMVQCYCIVGGLLWNDFANSSNYDEIWEGYWLCRYLEKMLSNHSYNDFSFEERDLLFFELYGSSFDMLCIATWRILKKFSNLHELLDDNIKSLLRLSENEFMKTIPPPKSIPSQWELPLEKNKNKKVVKLINYFKKLE